MTDLLDGSLGKEDDYLKANIACINPKHLHATLVSSAGSHCEVWRSSKRNASIAETSPYLEFVLKYPRGNHSSAEIAVLANHYRQLKTELEDVIPEAVFFITNIDEQANVCVIAEAVNIWFDIGNPQNRDEATELLKIHRKPRNQLRRFLNAAKEWRNSGNPRLIDLFGVNNLVMDTNREIRYLDSFFVFFFEDMLDLLHEPDSDLENNINRSIERLIYLEEILEQADEFNRNL